VGDGAVRFSPASSWSPSSPVDLLDAPTWFAAPSDVLPPESPSGVAHAVAAGKVAEAAILLGVADHAIGLAVEYAKLRMQFGKQIGQFQAIKHLLGEARTELAFADALVLGAALAVDDDGPFAARDAAVALLTAAETAELASRTALQVHGAIGYTDELPIGRLLAASRHGPEAWGGRTAQAEIVEASLLVADAHLGDGTASPSPHPSLTAQERES
ncbi:MAG: acyl-CoA dehydrogenase family protein, partial [Microbacterium sp.]